MMIERQRHEDVVELRLNRPPANALSPELVTALLAELEAARDEQTRALVLSGMTGIFSAGLDVPHLLTLDREGIRAAWKSFFRLLETLARFPVPVAAAITGHSPAGGAVLSIFCDYRVMAEGDFGIGLNEVQVGIPLPPVIYAALERVVGTRQAERLGVGGLLIDPQEARRVGLVDELRPPEEVVERAVTWCQSRLALPRGPMLKTRAAVRAELGALFDEVGAARLDELTADWFDSETQAALKAMVARIGKEA